MPRIKLGNLSVGLIVVLIVSVVFVNLLVSLGQTDGERVFDNLLFFIPMLIVAVSGFIALIIGLISIIKQQERSILVYISTLIGFLVTLFVLGEIFLPH